MAILITRSLVRAKWFRGLSAVIFLAILLGAQERRIVGPGGGGAMFHVTINPLHPNEVLLSCDMTGGYISHDGGHHWRMFNLRGSIHFFAFDPVHPHTLYAATNALWRSTDDGATWRLVWPQPSSVRAIAMDSDHADEMFLTGSGAAEEITALAIAPTDSRTLYAAFQRGEDNTLRVSQDAGATWHVLCPLKKPPLHLWLTPDSQTLYAATAEGISRYDQSRCQQWSSPSGVVLTDVAAGFPSKDVTPVFYAVGQKENSASELYVSTDAGATWRTSSLPGSGAQIRAAATSRDHPETAYVSYRNLQIDGKIFQGIARTRDYGRHWALVWRSTKAHEASNVHDAWIATAMTPEWTEEPLSITVDDHDPDLAYATDLGRTLATTDGGATWTARYSERADSVRGDSSWISTGLDVTTTYGYLFDPHDSRRWFILTTDIGLFRSEDSGRSWMRSVAGVPGRWRNTTYSVAFDPEVRGKMWAAMSDIHDLPRPKMWRHTSTSTYIGGICVSADGGRSWRASSDGMPSTAPTSILLDPRSPTGRRRLWVATMGHGIYRSIDDGRTWSPVNDGIVQKDPLAWRLAYASDGTLYALIARRSEDGSIGNAGDGALYRSGDGGDHWSPVSLPSGANAPNGIAIDPEDPRRLYLALWARATPRVTEDTQKPKDSSSKAPVILNGEGGGIAVSSDGGQTWRWTLQRDRHIYDVTLDPRDPKTLYAAGFESSAWISRDRGEHWTRIPDFNFKWGHRVQADPENPGEVYISTFGGGVWHIPVSGPKAQDIATPGFAP